MNSRKRILVTTDSSVRSRRVLPHAAAFGRACGAELLLLQVLNPKDTARKTPDELRQRVEATKDQLERMLRMAGVEGRALVGTLLAGEDVPSAILRIARDENAELLAMSSRGRGLVNRAIFGSISTAVLHRSDLPLMTCGPSVEYVSVSEPYRLLFTSDGSRASERVLQVLGPMLRDKNIEVVLLRVYMPALGDRGEREEVDAAQRALGDLAQLLPASVRISTLVDTRSSPGSPARTILEKADQLGVNALALSTHGHSLTHQFLMGSIAMEVWRRSPVPVILASVT